MYQTNGEATQFVYTAFLALNSPTLVTRMLSILLVQESYFHRGDLFSPFWGWGKERCQNIFFIHLLHLPMAVSEVTLIQNNQ